MQSSRKDRSRSPVRVDSAGRRRDGKNHNANTGDKPREAGDTQGVPQINPMMMTNMYSQGNMIMAGGMYPNMMMPGTMMGGSMMHPTGVEIMQGTGMDMVAQTSLDMSAMGNQTIASTGNTIDVSMMGGMMMDPSMIGMYPSMSTDMTAVGDKKEIVFKHCKLIPIDTPQPNCKTPRPPGCRTIFVGGWPSKTRESTVREIFESYGRIHTLRLSVKNYCHIRFYREECVEAAILLSGYRIQLTDSDDENSDEKANFGWLYVDYAMSRDDQHEYERNQRLALRVQRQQMKQLSAQQEMMNHSMSLTTYKRSPSPVRVVTFSNAAMVQLCEKIKSEDHFSSALPTLVAWLERGECSKKTANQFYTMIQTTNSHIQRLFSEKMQAEDELQECKERVKNQIAAVIDQLEQVGKLFVAASHQRVWDHFTKPQRKNIETWQKMTQEFKTLKEEFNEKFTSDDNDFNGVVSNRSSDSEELQQLKFKTLKEEFNEKFTSDDNDFNGVVSNRSSDSEELQQLKRENESLRFQLEAYKNEVDVIKSDGQKEIEKFKAQFIARQALLGAMDNNLPPPKPPTPSPISVKLSLPDDLDSKVHLTETIEAGCGEAKLIGVMSAFLQVHPKGASLDYVVSYVRALFPHVSQATIHHVLQRHQDVFRRSTTGVGANIEHRWSFIAFNNEELAK